MWRGDSADSGALVGHPGLDPEGAQKIGFPAVATKNTTRVAGGDPMVDAAGRGARRVPLRRTGHASTGVTLAPTGDWQAAIAASS